MRRWCCDTMTEALHPVPSSGSGLCETEDGSGVIVRSADGKVSAPFKKCPWCGIPPYVKRAPTAVRPWSGELPVPRGGSRQRQSVDQGSTLGYWSADGRFGGWWCRVSPDDPIVQMGTETGEAAEKLIDAWLTAHGITLLEAPLADLIRVYRMLPGTTFDASMPVYEAPVDMRALREEIDAQDVDTATCVTALARRTVYREIRGAWPDVDFYVIVEIAGLEHHRSVTRAIGLQPGGVTP